MEEEQCVPLEIASLPYVPCDAASQGPEDPQQYQLNMMSDVLFLKLISESNQDNILYCEMHNTGCKMMTLLIQ